MQGKGSTGTVVAAVAAVACVALVRIPCEMLQIFTKRWRKGVWDLKAVVDSGGMPSSHSALCSVRSSAVPGLTVYALRIYRFCVLHSNFTESVNAYRRSLQQQH